MNKKIDTFANKYGNNLTIMQHLQYPYFTSKAYNQNFFYEIFPKTASYKNMNNGTPVSAC